MSDAELRIMALEHLRRKMPLGTDGAILVDELDSLLAALNASDEDATYQSIDNLLEILSEVLPHE